MPDADSIAARKIAHPWLEAILAALGVVCGGAVAVLWLFLKPVVVVEHLPPAARRQPGEVYYVKGSRDVARGASWARKREALLEAAPASTITLNEDELNAWFASSARIRQINRKGAAADDNASVTATAGLPDFHIGRGTLQVAAPVTVRIFGLRAEVVVQARGTFARGHANAMNELAGALAPGRVPAPDARQVVLFSPAEIFAGSLPLHRIPGARTFLLREIFANETLPGAGVSAWQKIESAKISGSELQITMSQIAKPAGP